MEEIFRSLGLGRPPGTQPLTVKGYVVLCYVVVFYCYVTSFGSRHEDPQLGVTWPVLSRLILHLARRSLRPVLRYGTATGATSGHRPFGSKELDDVGSFEHIRTKCSDMSEMM